MRQFIFPTHTALDEPLGNKKASINHIVPVAEVIMPATPDTGEVCSDTRSGGGGIVAVTR